MNGNKSLNLTLAPIALGQGLEGVDEAPEILLRSGLREQIAELGFKIQKETQVKSGPLTWNSPLGHLPAHQQGHKIKFPTELGQACVEIANSVEQALQQGSFSLTLGGDHSIAIGSVGGALRAAPDLGVIWVDAHADFNTPETSPSGNIHGMPLSFLTGAMQDYGLQSFSWLRDFLSSNQIVWIGLRSIDPEERKRLRQFGARVFTMTEVDRYGIGGVMEQALHFLGSRPLYLSYDIDSLDPHFAPSTGTRVRGGLNYREAHYLAESVAETGRLVGMDLVEINPRLGPVESTLTTEIGLELIASALGKRIY
jgi:arginase